MAPVNEIIETTKPKSSRPYRQRRRFLREERERISGRDNWAWRNSPLRRP